MGIEDPNTQEHHEGAEIVLDSLIGYLETLKNHSGELTKEQIEKINKIGDDLDDLVDQFEK